MLDAHQAVTFRAHDDAGRPVILRVGADEAEYVFGAENGLGDGLRIPVRTGGGDVAEGGVFSEVAVHLRGRKDIGSGWAEGFLGPVQRADVKGNAAVRGAVGEELADQVLRRPPVVVLARIRIPGIGLQADFLHHAARHQTAHGMRDDDHLIRAGLL
jgi:hypothetical protein